VDCGRVVLLGRKNAAKAQRFVRQSRKVAVAAGKSPLEALRMLQLASSNRGKIQLPSQEDLHVRAR
jgi:hypothetical protein